MMSPALPKNIKTNNSGKRGGIYKEGRAG